MGNGDDNTEDGEMHITLQKREKGKTWSSNTRARKFGSICCRSRAKAAYAPKVSRRGLISLPPPLPCTSFIAVYSYLMLSRFTFFS